MTSNLEIIPNVNFETTSLKEFRCLLLTALYPTCIKDTSVNDTAVPDKRLVNDWIKEEITNHAAATLVQEKKEKPLLQSSNSVEQLSMDKIQAEETQEEKDRLLALKLQELENPRSMRFTRHRREKKVKPCSAVRSSNDRVIDKDELIPVPKKRKSGFPMCFTTPSLREFLGGLDTANSSQVTKEIWIYIKAHDLQDPKDRRFIFVDGKLGKLFCGKKRIKMTEIPGIVCKNLFPINQ